MDSTPTDEAAAWCALLRAPGVGCQTLNPLLASTRSARELVERPPPNLPDALRTYLRAPDWRGAEADMRWLEQPRNHLLTIVDPAYPVALRSLGNPPSALFLHGDPELLTLPQTAIVGSRNPSAGGRQTAHDFAAFLAAAGLVVSSGLATGIDAAAHRGALDADGLTLAATGTGLDRVYPAGNRALAHDIALNGLLVSEFPTGTPPLPGNFPRRNRILAGLSLGTLVVEAALHSGSLITARIAAETGREVFAIPGSIHNPLARGCHALIREGARLVERGEDLLEELAPLLAHTGFDLHTAPVATPAASSTDDPQHRALLEALGHAPATTDALVERTGFPAAEVSSILLLLELQGHVSSAPGGLFTRVGLSRE
ncbi:MAG: DNA-protecting protein DprA [Chromatiaceae bacterium]|nr:DNA-protecting protein DprA [Chromatiaceae bacterium]MCP5315278.1 DNA-protecting protein DprA [Chromatiaceae bacterium]